MDVSRKHTHARTLWLLLAATVAVALNLSITGIPTSAVGHGPSAPKPTDSALPLGLDPSISTSGSKRVRVKIFLTDNTFSHTLQAQAHTLTAPPAGTAEAKAFAIRNPKRGIPAERVIAARMDAQRNTALAALRSGAASGTRQSEDLEAFLKHRGARIIDSSPLPNSITANVPANLIASLAARSDVISVRNAPTPIWMSSPIDGSETWHSNGLTGNGTSQDGLGGPDYFVFDQGVRVTHQAFNKRMPGDPANGLGSGSTRIISPAGRTDFSGSQHGNVIAATVAATDLRLLATSGAPFPAQWPINKGLAYGVDKVYDMYQAQSPSRWALGISYNGEPGVNDLPEALNYSAGVYDDNIDSDPTWFEVENDVARYGITQTISAGNCGLPGTIYGCYDGVFPFAPMTHRVSTPGNLYNTITVGGWTGTDPYDNSTWTPWPNSSPGPTYGGRKKPDLLATPNPNAGGPVNLNDTGYSNPGNGTSFAAPQAAAGALLLASSGVYTPTAQKAILINTATPIQGQTYWTPTAGWGALNIGGTPQPGGTLANDGAFQNRGNYANASVTPAGINGTRFFKQTGVTSGDRTTLVWNRRTEDYWGGVGSNIFTLTNLDLFQVDQGSGTNTATGGVDANDTVDTDQTVSAANPMPGNGSDGQDNVEQTRSTAAGTEIYKVKAQSSIDGATSEPFALAGAHPITALQTPIPNVVLTPSASLVGPGTPVTVTATITNPSADLALSSAGVSLSVPAGVSITSGSPTQAIGTLAASGTSIKSWTVTGSSDGLQNVTATANGTTYSEPFAGSGSTNITVDATSPQLTIPAQNAWSASANVAFAWSATDASSAVDHYDVELSRNGGPFTPLLTGTAATSTAVSGAEGERLMLRVRAADTFGNRSSWSEQSVGIDATPPTVSIGAAAEAADGTLTVPVSIVNAGSPTTATYTFGPTGSARVNQGTVTGATVRYVFGRMASTTYPVLTVTATDGLGRTVSATRVFTVAGSRHEANLRITSAKKSGGYLVVRGTLDRSAKGSVRVLTTRVGHTGTRRATKTLRIRSGRYSGRLKLAPGRYRVTVTYGGAGNVAAAKISKRVRVG